MPGIRASKICTYKLTPGEKEKDSAYTHWCLIGTNHAPALRDELVAASRIINGPKTFLIGTNLVSHFGSATSEQIATNDRKVCEEFANLRVGGDERKQGAEVLQCLPSVFFDLLLVDGYDFRGVFLGGADINLASVPDEVLEKLVCILLLDDQLSSLNNITGILNEPLAFGREGMNVDWRMFQDIVKGIVDLLVGGHLRLAECMDDAIEAEFAVNVCGLRLFVDRIHDGVGGRMRVDIFCCWWKRHCGLRNILVCVQIS